MVDRVLRYVLCLLRYENTEKRKAHVTKKGLLYIGMGVSGGEEGARNGKAGCEDGYWG